MNLSHDVVLEAEGSRLRSCVLLFHSSQVAEIKAALYLALDDSDTTFLLTCNPEDMIITTVRILDGIIRVIIARSLLFMSSSKRVNYIRG
ncbi:hypothetical protein CDL15_Pgr024232 [Punica granatum]|uniref:Uncharacterized protein n=1 Tax=Punica granatum TaxID=22663 RepID=A0A218XX10_PUNGR|nr:hypothetical protein CDL15_Pgr024232 [Punica granatum]